MKKQILKIAVILGLLYTSNLFAMTQEEYQKMVSSYKLVKVGDGEYSILNSTPLTYVQEDKLLKSNNIEYGAYGKFKKYFKINGEITSFGITLNLPLNEIIQYIDEPRGSSSISYDPFNVNFYDQRLYAVACLSKKKEIVISPILQSSSKDKKILFQELPSTTAEYYEDYIDNYFHIDLVQDNLSLSIDKPYEDNKDFPYFNEEKILNRLYEKNDCDKKETEKANIEVFLANGEWVSQEKSWDIIKNEALNNTIYTPNLTLDKLLENAKTNQNIYLWDIEEVLMNEELNIKTVQKYNNIAYYLQQANANDEAIFLLEEILEKFPNRTVAYINLADAYLGINDIEKAKQNYDKYVKLMKQDNKEEKIPKRVLEFLKN